MNAAARIPFARPQQTSYRKLERQPEIGTIFVLRDRVSLKHARPTLDDPMLVEDPFSVLT
ncbi:MAG: hypothetical protein JO231_24635 [Acidobacteria bacterium]|nr:hypothetical protein [Acidobacteriota bacterium]